MKFSFLKLNSLTAVFCTIFGLFFFHILSAQMSSETNFQIQIMAVCGNNSAEWNEDCDGEEIGMGTCITEGFNSGSLSCNEDCTYNTEECEIILPTATGGAGRAAYIPPQITKTTVFFSGYAYPSGYITLYKDSQNIATTTAESDGKFVISLSDFPGGNYVFSFAAKDSIGRRSSYLTFNSDLSYKSMTEINDIFLSPTLSVDNDVFKQNEKLVFSGESIPGAEVTVEVPDMGLSKKVITDPYGKYSVVFDTLNMVEGDYVVRANAEFEEKKSDFSRTVDFSLVASEKFTEETGKEYKKLIRGDLNNDGLVNIVDFSIGIFWYKEPLNPKMSLVEERVLNKDNKIDLRDFSIMAYYWTG